MRAYCILLIIIAVACFLLTVAVPVPIPWPHSVLGRIVLALIVGLIGARALASMMVRVGGRVVLEGFWT